MSDVDFMQRALYLAAAGVGQTGDNPSVGCVIVRDGAVIAEARTGDGGRPHAEEQAVALADARGATVYVTLEPCAKRTSGTMSCADRLIEAGVARVVIAASDPHPFAAGVGVERLRAAGVVVRIGVLALESRSLNVDFFSRWGDGGVPDDATVAIVEDLGREFPAVAALLADHRQANDGVLPYVFLGGDLYALIERAALNGGAAERATAQKIITALGNAFDAGTEPVRNLVALSLLEGLSNSGEPSDTIRDWLPDVLLKELRCMQAR